MSEAKPTRREHRVEFFSPGTFVSESSTKPVDSWDIVEACRMARQVVERHGAKPYAFQFSTVLAADPIDDGEGGTLDVAPKEIARSGNHHLGGRIRRYDEIPDTDENNILRGNMRCNEYPFVVENCNSYKSTHPFDAQDVLVDAENGDVLKRGEDHDLMDYRQEFSRMRKEYYQHLKETV